MDHALPNRDGTAFKIGGTRDVKILTIKKARKRNVSGPFTTSYTTPCAFIASATFKKPAMFAPAT